MGFPNEAFPSPDLCSLKRGAGLREPFRAAAYAVVVCRMPYAVAALPRGGTGLRNEKTFLPFADAFGDSAKLFAGACACPPGAARAFSQSEARRIRDFATLPDRRGAHSRRGRPALRSFWPAPEALAGMRLLGAQHRQPVLFARDVVSARGRGKMCSSGAALRENRKKDCPLVPGGFCRRAQRRFCARFGRLRLLAGKHVCVPTAPLGRRCGKPAKRDFSPVRGPLRDGCGRLTEVYGIRAPAADMVCGAL